ncbi:hypothetical protein HDU88_008421 [Geranomyces variabilis]|nr:hypothetical protein HDU88_008421 [Geranomyces variabilis]
MQNMTSPLDKYVRNLIHRGQFEEGEDISDYGYPHNNGKWAVTTRKDIVNRLKKWQEHKIFKSNATLANVDKVVEIIKKSKGQRKFTDDTLGQDCKWMHHFLIHLKPELCGMTESEHRKITAAYNDRHRGKKRGLSNHAKLLRNTRRFERIPKYVQRAILARKYAEKQEAIFWAKDPAKIRLLDFNDYTDAVQTAFTIMVPNVRSNAGTLKVGCHPNANSEVDNVLYTDPTNGTAEAVWNERKQDRMGLCGPRPDEDEDEDDGNRFVYKYGAVPFPEVANPTLDPEWGAKLIARYLSHPSKKGHEYVFSDKNGNPLAKPLTKADGTLYRNANGFTEWDFRPFCKRFLITTKKIWGEAYGISKLRPAQITLMHRNQLSVDALHWVSTNCHHSAEESNKYGNCSQVALDEDADSESANAEDADLVDAGLGESLDEDADSEAEDADSVNSGLGESSDEDATSSM